MKNKKIVKRLTIGLSSSLLIGCIAMVFITGYITFNNITQLSANETTGVENSVSFFDEIGFDYVGFQQTYHIETINLTSTLDGHAIPADYIYSQDRNADTVVMVHGLGGNRQSIFPIASLFLQKGYNVLTFDQRSAGENTAQYTTFGYLESCDVADCVDYLDGVLGANENIYLWGVSNGAATVGISVRHEIVESRVTSIMLDCPFSGTDEMMRMEAGQMDIGIPLDFMMFCGDLYNRIALGFSYAEASAAARLAESDLPILIIASKADELTPYWMAEKLYKASSNATLVSVDDSEHAEIFFDYPHWYAAAIDQFVK